MISNLARVNAQIIKSARKLKMTTDEAHNAFCLSLIIDINRKSTLALLT